MQTELTQVNFLWILSQGLISPRQRPNSRRAAALRGMSAFSAGAASFDAATPAYFAAATLSSFAPTALASFAAAAITSFTAFALASFAAGSLAPSSRPCALSCPSNRMQNHAGAPSFGGALARGRPALDVRDDGSRPPRADPSIVTLTPRSQQAPITKPVQALTLSWKKGRDV